ncbi:LysM peptidoglycan-binding domain-containing protein [Sporosarcina sp. FSL W7-1349]|uniref:LysM peptidoglycan-binding domain-containing protein n=1 Tax=Sporosarcina sp. FSL W7-1349 TaxID=2921561 RepID=UPI0030F8F2A8
MDKDDFKAEFEEHRKEISLEEEDDSGRLPSRVELHRTKRNPKRKSNHLLLNVILGLFTLIPVGILVYVISDFYSPDDKTSAQVEDSGVRIEIDNSEPQSKDAAAEKSDPDEQTLAEKTGSTSNEPAKPVEAVKEPASTPQPETKPTPPKPEQPAEKPKADPKPEQPQSTGKTHVVAASETLYRIAVNYYGSGSDANLEKIRRANGLSSNNIQVGQKLIIP